MQEIDKKKLNATIIRFEKIINQLIKTKDRMLMIPLTNLQPEINLIMADFKCQNPNCMKEEYLQFHHLITRKAKDYIDIIIYLSRRHHWRNIIVLCVDCHKKYHEFVVNGSDYEKGFLEKKKMQNIKEKYMKES